MKITQKFIWETIVPIAQRYDPQYVNLIPMSFFYDTQPKEWKDKFESGECGCIADLGLPKDIVDAHINPVCYSKVKWECADEQWTWDHFKKELFKPAREEIVWDSMLLSLRNNGMSYSSYSKNSDFCRKIGYYPPNAFERGEQIGILIHPESHYKGWMNCKMWNDWLSYYKS